MALAEWLGREPTKEAIAGDLHHYLRLLHEILVFLERGKHGKFSMLPLASGVTPSHIGITSSCLAELLGATQKEWRERDKEAAWRASFSLGALETRGRRFALFISTNGFSACNTR